MSGMPWQLREGLKRHPKGSRPPRLIVEQLPCININHIKVPRDYNIHIAPNISLRYPDISSMRIAWNMVQFTHKSLHRGSEGHTEKFGLKQIRTGLGGYFRHAFICSCGRPVTKLYVHHRHIACRYCHGAIRASQAINQQQRPLLAASRIQSFLDNKPRLLHRIQERLRKRLGDKLMIAQSRLGTRSRTNILD